jgi:hypothetical protein
LKSGGIVFFQYARVFYGAWTTPDYGRLKFVDHVFPSGRARERKIVEEIHSFLSSIEIDNLAAKCKGDLKIA